jgi:hypothetical protein
MEVVERSEFRDESGAISLQNRARGMLRHGLQWYNEMEAQTAVKDRLGTVLGSDHVLIRNLVLPGTEMEIPMILLSPQGVRAIVVTPIKGIYRAKEGEWLTYDNTLRKFRRVRPNLVQAVLSMAEALLGYFHQRGFGVPEVEPVLVLANPLTHVDTANPKARIVMSDGVEHFAANLLQSEVIMDEEDIATLVECLTRPVQPQASAVPGAATLPAFEDSAAGGQSLPRVPPFVEGVDLPPVPTGPLVRGLWVDPEADGADAFYAVEEIAEDDSLRASDVLPALQQGLKDSLPRLRENLPRLQERVQKAAEEGAVRLDKTSTRIARRVPEIVGPLPRYSTAKWILVGCLSFLIIVAFIAIMFFLISVLLY